MCLSTTNTTHTFQIYYMLWNSVGFSFDSNRLFFVMAVEKLRSFSVERLIHSSRRIYGVSYELMAHIFSYIEVARDSLTHARKSVFCQFRFNFRNRLIYAFIFLSMWTKVSSTWLLSLLYRHINENSYSHIMKLFVWPFQNELKAKAMSPCCGSLLLLWPVRVCERVCKYGWCVCT